MTTLLEVIQKGTDFLEKKGVDSARYNMEQLICHELSLNRMQLYLAFDQPVAEESLEKLRALLKRRGSREPLQHILGSVEFFGNEFKSDSRALIPRPETEELVDLIVKHYKEAPPKRILDFCSGSGVIGLSLKSVFGELSEVTLADVSEEALVLSAENAEQLSLEVNSVCSDLFTKIEGQFDLIVSNPPYVADAYQGKVEPEVAHDPALALYSGVDGLDLIKRLVPQSLDHLTVDGALWMEIGYDQNKAVEKLMEEGRFSEIETLIDLSGVPRFPKGIKKN